MHSFSITALWKVFIILSFLLDSSRVWLMYAFKTAHFFFACIKKDAYSFLLQFLSVPLKKRCMALAYLQTILFLPVWIYGFLIFYYCHKGESSYSGLYVLITILTP
ncbi:MAG: hypothetical protein WDO71_15640 [Bacteroidota bacterium]